MATQVLMASMPIVELAPGFRLVLEAISPTTGLPVTGVKVSAIGVTATDLSGESGGGGDVANFGPFMLVPGPGA